MTVVWQEIVALALVVLAAIYVVYRAWRYLVSRSPEQGCGSSCTGCGDESAGKQQPFISVDTLGTRHQKPKHEREVK